MSKKPIKVTLKMSEITYDIQNNTYLKGVRMDDGSNYESAYNIQLDARDENYNKMLRSISTAWANLRLETRKYLNIAKNENPDNILIDDKGDITVQLLMPDNWNDANTDVLPEIMHQYIVNFAIAEWMAVSNTEDASQYYTDAAAYMSRLKVAMCDRVAPASRIGCMLG